MPQEFHVVRCYSCETFQVQIIKKINKFECKMCCEKQSVKKEYGKGTGKDCRLHVQNLNKMRIEIRDRVEIQDDNFQEKNEYNTISKSPQESGVSKWSEYLSEQKVPTDEDEEVENSKYTFERQKKRKNRAKKPENTNSSKKLKQSVYNDLDEKNCSNYCFHDVKYTNNSAKKKNVALQKMAEKSNSIHESYDDEQNYNNKLNNTVEQASNKTYKNPVGQELMFENEQKKEFNIASVDLPTKHVEIKLKKSKWGSFIDNNETETDNLSSSNYVNNLSINEFQSQISKEKIFSILESEENLDDILNF